VVQREELVARAPELSDESVTSVRVIYPDLHGVVRGKDVPIGEFERAMEHGLAFCAAVMGTDLRHTPVVGGEEGYPDLIAYPDLSTMTLVPWEPGLAWCIADLRSAGEHAPPADPRGAVRRAVAAFEELGLAPVVGPELEFFLCERDLESPNGVRRYVDNLSMVYTVGPQADPRGIAREIAEALSTAPSRTSPRYTASSPRSWASRSTTRAAPASTSTFHSTATARTPSPTTQMRTASRPRCATSQPACSPTRAVSPRS
jgi:glutamine synthetase